MSHPPPFKTPQGEAAFLAAYDAAMKLWPVPYEEIDVPSRFGMTHIIASGPKDAPPLVVVHGYTATATMWAPKRSVPLGQWKGDPRWFRLSS